MTPRPEQGAPEPSGGYVLDGIPTAMVSRTMIAGAPYQPIAYGVAVECSCGWDVTTQDEGFRDALRFHYTHCPKAKAQCLEHAWEYRDTIHICRNCGTTRG